MSIVEDHTGMSAQYRERLVAFVDILGWKRLVAESSADNGLLNRIAMLSSAQNGMGDISASANGIRHIRMSDASVFIADPNNRTQVLTLVLAIQNLHQTALLNGWLVRGGLVLGEIYFSETTSTILGPALTAAYELETNVSHFPRTVIDSGAEALLRKIYSETDIRDEFLKQFPRTNGIPLVRNADDSIAFVSYLGNFLDLICKTHYRSQILEKLKEHENDVRVFQKYSWIWNYFRSAYGERI